jgi:hypothetical protein
MTYRVTPQKFAQQSKLVEEPTLVTTDLLAGALNNVSFKNK